VQKRPSLVEAQRKAMLRLVSWNGAGYFAQIIPLESPVPKLSNTQLMLKFIPQLDDLTQGSLDPGATPKVKLWMRMEEGDHGSNPVTVTPQRDAQGQFSFLLEQVFFTMGGRWEIHVEFKDPDKQSLNAVIEIDV
jgi:hypothetical protein